MRYAENTKVSSNKSRDEIERTLTRYGADQFMYGWQGDAALIAFRAGGRHIKFVLPLPDRDSREFTHTPAQGKLRSPDQQEAEYEKSVRQRWRALALVIKAKLEAVEAGIVAFESEFMAHIVLPSGRTVAEEALPAIAHAYETGQTPALLPHLDNEMRPKPRKLPP